MSKLRERTDFPAADGWVAFGNDSRHPISIVIEPWGLGGVVPVGEAAYVLIRPDNGSPAKIIVSDDTLQIYCADAMYHNGKEVVDMTDD